MKIFSFKSDDITNLGAEGAVIFFRELLWAEASRVDIGRQLINVPDCVNVGDGGLDALVEDAAPLSSDVIPQGTSGFQIKSSDLTPAKCKQELHSSGDIDEDLKPGIKRVLDNDGVYIIVLFAELADPAIKRRENIIIEDLKNNGYTDPKIRLYTANKIIGFAERFPALLAKLKPELFECIPYETWSDDVNISVPKNFIEDGYRTKTITEIREKLREKNDRATFIRVTGLSGVGKKRLVFEALSPDDLQSIVIFVRSEPFKNSKLFNYILTENDLSAIIVIDECSKKDHNHYYNRMGNKGSRLAVITISDEMGVVPPPTAIHNLKQLSEEKITELLEEEFADLNSSLCHRFAEIAEGYPKIALLLVENYISKAMETNDILSINDQDLIDELIAGDLSRFSEDFRKIKKVLMGISIFKKVGYKEDLVAQAKWVSEYMGVSWDDFQLIIKEQKERGIITGNYFISINPFLLEIYLVREWWETFARITSEEDFNSFIESIPEEFRREFYLGFISHFPFIGITEPGRQLLNNMLSETGIFADGNILISRSGSDFFTKLGEASPELALNILNQTIGKWDDTKLGEFINGRNNILYFLKKLAYRSEYFENATLLILKLAESQPKNQNFTLNDAHKAFADLFSPAWGELNTTVVPPKERVFILKEMINSDSITKKQIALSAFSRCLTWGYFHREVGSEYLGDKPLPENWIPETYGEIFEFFEEIWKYLAKQVESSDEVVRERAIEILLNNARNMSTTSIGLNDLVKETILLLFNKNFITRLKALRIVSSIIEFESKRFSPEIIEKWRELKNQLISDTFHDRLHMFLKLSQVDLGIIDNKYNEKKGIDREIKELAQEVINNINLLDSEWTWLITENLYNIWEFGKCLGELDQELVLIDSMIQNYDEISQASDIRLLSGYLHSISQKDEELFRLKLNDILENTKVRKFIPEIIMRSRVNDNSIEIIISLLESNEIDLNFLESYKMSGIRGDLSVEVFIHLMDLILEKFPIEGSLLGITSVFFYFNIYKFRGIESKELPVEFTLKLLNMPAFWEDSILCYARGETYPNSCPQYWIETLERFIEQHPEKFTFFLDKFIEFLEGKSYSDISHQEKNIRRALFYITKMDPDEVWNRIKNVLLPVRDPRSSFLAHWLSGGIDKISPLTLFNPDDIWDWVEEDVEERAPYLASFIPAILFHSEDDSCLTREFLMKYGNIENVRRSFSINFFNSSGIITSSKTYPPSMTYKSRKESLIEFSKDEEDTNVKKWISEYISNYINRDIRRAEIEEERGIL